MVQVIVDGRAIELEDGGTVLEALEQAGTRLPALCHDPRVAPRAPAGSASSRSAARRARCRPARRRPSRGWWSRRARRRSRPGGARSSGCSRRASRPPSATIGCRRPCARTGSSPAAPPIRRAPTLGIPERFTRTTCPYCGVGCELEVGTRGDRIVQIRPALDAPVNKGHLCVKGRYAFGFVDAPDRVTAPMLRDGGGWREVSWPDAIAHVAERLAAIRDAAGPGAIGVLGSARATNEENYVAQKLARAVLGTNNVDCCARVCHAPSAAALAAVFGTGAATSAFDDIERAATIVVLGANSTESHPVVGDRPRPRSRRTARS